MKSQEENNMKDNNYIFLKFKNIDKKVYLFKNTYYTPNFFIRSTDNFKKASSYRKFFLNLSALKRLFRFLNFDIFPMKKLNLKRQNKNIRTFAYLTSVRS